MRLIPRSANWTTLPPRTPRARVRKLTRDFSHEIHSHHRPRSPRAAQDAEQDVLRVPGRIRRAAELAYLPGVPGLSRGAAGDERGRPEDERSHGTDAGLQCAGYLQIRPE